MSDESNAKRSVVCICCKRSKIQGTFFVTKPFIYEDRDWAWKIQGWEAAVDAFRTATEHGCRRCKVVSEVALAFGEGAIDLDFDSVLDSPTNRSDHEMVTMVEIVLKGKRRVALELLHSPGNGLYHSVSESCSLTVT